MCKHLHKIDLFNLSSLFSLSHLIELPADENPENQQKLIYLTTDSEQNDRLNQIQSLSRKKRTNKVEISFEKDFMKQHSSVFKESYQNYLEFLRKPTSKAEKLSQLESIETKTDFQPLTIAQLLNSQECTLTLQQKNQFLKDLLHEEKLHEFLLTVVRTVLPIDALFMLLVAHRTWLQFVPLQNIDFTVKEIVQLADKITQQQLMPKCKEWLREEEKNDEKLQALTLFVQIYCSTILLTITEYFENPFYNEQGQEEDRKRSFSKALSKTYFQDQDQFDSPLPFKKRK